MRLIDADYLIDYWKPDVGRGFVADYFIWTVDHAQTIDAVPVIRCKDCKHWYEKYRHGVDMSACKRAIGYFGANDYCSMAERKEE